MGRVLAASAQYLVAQQSTAAAALTAEQELIRRLPDDWRLTALRYHVFSDFDSGIAASTEVAAEEIRLLALRRLAGIYGAEEFVARHLEDELENVRASGHQTPEARRRDILTAVLRNLGGRQNWINNPLTLRCSKKKPTPIPTHAFLLPPWRLCTIWRSGGCSLQLKRASHASVTITTTTRTKSTGWKTNRTSYFTSGMELICQPSCGSHRRCFRFRRKPVRSASR